MGVTQNRKNSTSKSLTAYIRKIVIFSTLLMTVFIATLISIHEILIFRDISEQQQTTHLEEHKEFIRDLIQIEIAYIASQKKLFDERMIEAVKQNVCNAHSMADKIYTTYGKTLSETEMQNLIIEVVGALDCGSPYRHVFINGMDGNGVFYPGRPDYTGMNLLGHTDMNGNQVVRSELELLKKQKEGFVRYSENDKIVTDSLPQNKIVYIKKHDGLNWYFGSKTYLEDYYDEFKQEIARKISADHFRYGGYVFINEADGDPVVIDGQAYEGDYNFFDGSDPEKEAVFQQELKTVDNATKGGFFTYRWKKMGKEEKVPKISYVQFYPETNWIVGAGFYLDEIWDEISAQKQKLKYDLIKNLVVVLLVLLLVILGEMLIIYRFNSIYFADFNNFTRFFRAGKQSYHPINLDNLYFMEFQEMGKVANEMITEREKVYKQLVLQQKKAEEADRLKTAFLANMSHEIRTPMNAILGFSSLLNDPEINVEEKKVYIQLIQKNGELLLKLINDIIDISKIESDQLTITEEEFRLQELLDEIHWHYKELIGSGTNARVIFQMENNLPANFVCFTDKLRLKQVLDNLIGNSIKFTEKGSIKLRIDQRGEYLHFKVQDTGIGISPDDSKNIFQRFIQAKNGTRKTYGGTGLGLAISQKIIHLMGGDIGVKSIEEEGSEFYFYIPIHPPKM